MTEIIIGLDPGVLGALAFASRAGIEVFDMPTEIATTGKRRVSALGVARLLRNRIGEHYECVALIERAQASPADLGGGKKGMGNVSAFSYGQGYGILLGALEALGVSTLLVQAAQWKRQMGVTGGAGFGKGAPDKKPAIAMARALVPELSTEIYKASHGGRAEAVLIACYARLRFAKDGVTVPEWLPQLPQVAQGETLHDMHGNATPSPPAREMETALGDLEF